MAAPKLAMAGKHMAQPMADTTAPNELALSPMRVKRLSRFFISIRPLLLYHRWIAGIFCGLGQLFHRSFFIIKSDHG